MVHYLFFEDGSAVLPILGIAFHERPAIDIADVGTAIGAEKVEPTYFLLKLLNNLVADEFLVRSKNDRKSHLLSLFVALNHTI